METVRSRSRSRSRSNINIVSPHNAELQELVGDERRVVQEKGIARMEAALESILDKFESIEERLVRIEQTGDEIGNELTKQGENALKPDDIEKLKDDLRKGLNKSMNQLDHHGAKLVEECWRTSKVNIKKCFLKLLQIILSCMILTYRFFQLVHQTISQAAGIPSYALLPPVISTIVHGTFTQMMALLLGWIYINVWVGALTLGYMDGTSLVVFACECSVTITTWMIMNTKGTFTYVIKDMARVPRALGVNRALTYIYDTTVETLTPRILPTISTSVISNVGNVTQIVGDSVTSMIGKVPTLVNSTQISDAASSVARRIFGNVGTTLISGGSKTNSDGTNKRSTRSTTKSSARSAAKNNTKSSSRSTTKNNSKNTTRTANRSVVNRQPVTAEEMKQAFNILNLTLRISAKFMKIQLHLLMLRLEYGDTKRTTFSQNYPLRIAGVDTTMPIEFNKKLI